MAVAPRVGAWIETGSKPLEVVGELTSHPVWVRGLKPLLIQYSN